VSRDASDHASLPAGFGPYRVEREIGTGVLRERLRRDGAVLETPA
jgi:hypothetical protein